MYENQKITGSTPRPEHHLKFSTDIVIVILF